MLTNRSAYLSPKLEVRTHPEKGGVGGFAREFIQAGELLAVWCGEIVTWEKLCQLSQARKQRSIQVEEALYLISLEPDEPADCINHCCEPNAGLDGQIILRAMRDITPGEEVCFDYAMSDGSPYDEFECTCGAKNCRHWITGEDWRRPELQRKYANWFSPYLRRRIEQLAPERIHYQNGFTPKIGTIL
ncbi:MAG: SET domain-containing protein-lysine N-methyltransferase [Chloroflexi bacterium]|nr:SET domain-containing protein-lysine N-methyltransferase [Chloroflexota bacterium]